MTGQFGKRGHRFGQRSALAYYQFVVTDIKCLLLAYLVEITGSQDGDGHCAIILFIESSFYEGTLNAQCRWRVEVLLAQTLDAVVHAAIVFWIFNVVVHMLLFA